MGPSLFYCSLSHQVIPPSLGVSACFLRAHGIYADLDRYMGRRHLVGILVEGIKNCSL